MQWRQKVADQKSNNAESNVSGTIFRDVFSEYIDCFFKKISAVKVFYRIWSIFNGFRLKSLRPLIQKLEMCISSHDFLPICTICELFPKYLKIDSNLRNYLQEFNVDLSFFSKFNFTVTILQ